MLFQKKEQLSLYKSTSAREDWCIPDINKNLLIRNDHRISLLMLNEFQIINQLLFPPKTTRKPEVHCIGFLMISGE